MNSAHPTPDPVPLFVDLDGTLVKTDLLLESALRLLKKSPLSLFACLVWLIRGGKAGLKAEIARRVGLDANLLPLQNDFVDFLRDEAAAGRTLYLATASDWLLAEPVANRLGVFTGLLASTPGNNLKGTRKLEAILAKTGGGPFDYAGNAHADMPVWAAARQALVVNPEPGVAAAAQARFNVKRVFEDRPPGLPTWLRAIRLYQWLKNLLLFVPLLTAHVFTGTALMTLALAFTAIGCVASGTYLLNDLLDLDADRRHPRKSKRPFAAGNISPAFGLLAMLALLVTGLGMAAALTIPFFLSTLAYLVLTLSYSFHFKTYVLIDVLLLAGLYTVRIIAGALAIGVSVSSWLLAFSIFVFLNLALVKRCSELKALESQARTATSGRDYRLSDLGILSSMGVAAGYISVLVLALYVDNPDVRTAYSHPFLLWLLCPFMMYWVSRLWIKTSRGEMNDDPLLYSLRDRASWIIFLAMGLTTLLAI
ncbi:MAG: UbiA family prenyltransferase [Thiobacillus sp.]|nr:UbiA family prenyltransferase [Thiobacillus sp.]